MNSKQTKAPLAAALSPFMRLLYHPTYTHVNNVMWCVKVDRTTGVNIIPWVTFTSHKNQVSVSAVRHDLQFFVLVREDKQV